MEILKQKPTVVVVVQSAIPITGAALPVEGQRLHYTDACECGAWHLEIWPRGKPGEKRSVVFRCRSWRHAGECRLWKGAQDFSRCKSALLKYDYWLHSCLTFSQPPGVKAQELFLAGKERWSKLRKRLVREYGKFRYIQTWEIHRSGIPHVHLALSSVKLFESSIADPRENFARLIRPAAVECGFGPVGWIERLNSKEAFAGYLCKLSLIHI